MIYLFCSSSESGPEQRHMWEEVALRYQQILHREYRMLNLPTYPVQGGNFYLYYVPVIVNQGYLPQNYGAQIQHNGVTAAQKTGKHKEDVIYIDDSDDDCDSNVKEEPLESVQAVESSYGRNIKVKSKEETFPYHTVSCKLEKNKLHNATSSMEWDETTMKVGERFDSCAEYKKHTENSNNRRGGSSTSDENIQDHYDNYNIEVTEDFIRIFKGYTIEYHPLHRDNTVMQRTRRPAAQQCSGRDEKIQDLKKRVAEHRVELDKLKLQQSIAGSGYRNGVSQRFTDKYFNGGVNESWKENNRSSFTGQRARDLLKDCPSAQIHYLPSGERKTLLPRRRKQTLPRRVDALLNVRAEGGALSDAKISQPEKSVSGEVIDNLSVKRKRKLSPYPETVKEKINKGTKHVQCSKKSKKAQRVSPLPSKDIQNVPVKLCCVANSLQATMPQDISQEEFLSVFGLLRTNVQQGETFKA